MEAQVRQVIIRYISHHLLRTLDATEIILLATSRFPGLDRVIFERMSDAERAEACSVDRDQIVCVEHRCFFYAQFGNELRRIESIENEIERSNV